MIMFPSNILPTKDSKVSTVGKLLKKEFGANYTQVRPKSTRLLTKFSMTYIVTSEELDVIRSFFENHFGSAFLFTHPYKHTIHEVYFENESLEEDIISYGIFKIKLDIHEV